MTESWTPYGLEHLRAATLKKRRVRALALVAILLVGWALLTDSTTTTETDVLAGGGRNTISLEVPEQEQRTGPDAVVQVSPGRIIRAAAGDPQAAEPQTQRPALPTADVAPINWAGVLWGLVPLAALGAVLWGGFRVRGTTEEVNYGVYKGAMPIEMITASHAHLVLTSKAARGSIFGRGREDHVPESRFLALGREAGEP